MALLQDAGINDVSGVEDLFKEMVGTVLENGLDGELENELGLFCVYGLKGFREAIADVYPKAQIQRCIIHQILCSTRFVGYKDIKKLVYKAVTEEEALENLMTFKQKWGQKYPSCIKTWEDNWDVFKHFLRIPS